MFLQRIDGPWIRHGLWRQRFLINDEAALETVVTSGAQYCWIDTDKGLAAGVPRDPQPPSADESRSSRELPASNDASCHNPPQPAADGPRPTHKNTRTARTADELNEASRICDEARAVVADTFTDMSAGRIPQMKNVGLIVEEVVASVCRNTEALVSLARLRTSDDTTYMHSVAVCALMVALGRSLGLDEARCRNFGMGGLFHDVGKTKVPFDILNKPGGLDDKEFEIIRGHPALGHEMLVQSGLLNEEVLDVCLHHHEKIDGTGYPNKLNRQTISLAARMGAVCDVYDAVTSNRPYKTAWDPSEALRRMTSWEGHFDRAVLAALVKALGIYPVGSVLRLASQRLAVVVENPPGALSKPIVKVFYSLTSLMRVPEELVDLGKLGTRDRILSREPAAAELFPDLHKLWSDR